MNSTQLKLSIFFHSKKYSEKRGLLPEEHKTALIFKHISDNFLNASYLNIQKNKNWKARLKKPHPQLKGSREMASSNSSDALLMNIFCHPKINSWKGMRDLFNVKEIKPNFGFEPGIPLKNGQKDSTEIDLSLGDIFAEAKITESDFTQKNIRIVENYRDVKEVFHFEKLSKANNKILNYQVIRNILAAVNCDKRHILICDDRRGDLIKSYYDVVKCIKSVDTRKRCDIIFWQDICKQVGRDLKEFLAEKYGIGGK